MDHLAPASEFQVLLLSAVGELHDASSPEKLSSIKGNHKSLASVKDHAHGTLFYSRNVVVRNFLLTSFVLLLVFTFLNWASRLRSWRRRRRRRPVHAISKDSYFDSKASFDGQTAGPDASSENLSSASTLYGDASSPKRPRLNPIGGERRPLLVKPKSDNGSAWYFSWIYTVKAWLVYQPKPIPFFNKTLPPNHTTMTVLVFIGIELFYTIHNITFSISKLFVFADRTSVVFMINLPLLYLLAAKNQPLKLLTGYSYESLNIFHRRLGEFMCFLAFLHSAGMFGVWYTFLRPSGFTLARFIFRKIIFLGLWAFVAYELLYFTSLGSFRKRWYELFLATHVFLQVAALTLLWFHHHNSRLPVGIALGIFLIDRLIYRMILKKEAVRATLEIRDKSTIIIRARIPQTGKQREIVRFSTTHGWDPTDHVFLTVPSLSRKHIIQAHPFTIASRAPNLYDTEPSLELIIRAQDGFTRDLLRLSQSHNTAEILLDGPYGSQSAVRMLQDCDLPIIIAGGSGIAVAFPLTWSLLHPDNPTDPESLPPFAASPQQQRPLLIWIVRTASHLTWLNPGRLDELRARGADVMIPPPTSEKGHPDLTAIVTAWLADRAGEVGVVCSGPDGMNRDVSNLCSGLLRRGRNVGVEIEKFGW